jgi:dipeptidyl aminopeptidase/acylaminoacyl peptidase
MTVAPYGTWPSPLTAEAVVARSVSLGEVRVGDDDVWWAELRPEEAGRVQLVRHRPGGQAIDVLPDGFSARTRVHEYGGGAWWLHDRSLFFANWADQRLYRLEPDATPVALTPEPAVPGGDRYADGTLTGDARWVICVRERHDPARGDHDLDPANELVAVPAHGGRDPVVLVHGPDFVSSPCVSPDGARLAWLQWNHPNMPWDGTELWVGELTSSGGAAGPGAITLRGARRVAGGVDESLHQPGWLADGSLLVTSDRSGRWNLVRVPPTALDGGGTDETASPAAQPPAEPYGTIDGDIATPQWVFGQSRWAALPDGRVLCAYARDGFDHLGVVPAGGGAVTPVPGPFTELSSLHAFGAGAVCLGGSPTAEPAVAVLDLPTDHTDHTDHTGHTGHTGHIDDARALGVAVVRPPRDVGLDDRWWSRPEPFAYPTSGGALAHALLYRPTNPEAVAPDGERPPVVVMIHGGPTSAARTQLSLATQYWTTRGFAVVDVNYRGSTGYGRAYRRALDGEWGVADVEDCAHAVRHLAEVGLVDGERAAIRGGSAGGFTALRALVCTDAFHVGASLYGVTDLHALARDTHKFEARYLDTLIGPLPEYTARYDERSPINHLDGLDRPLVVFQGLEDRIVPPAQAEALVEACRAKGVPHAYVAFPDEQHGFRNADNIRRVLDAERYFYGRVFGFEPVTDPEPVVIEGL